MFGSGRDKLHKAELEAKQPVQVSACLGEEAEQRVCRVTKVVSLRLFLYQEMPSPISSPHPQSTPAETNSSASLFQGERVGAHTT